MAVVIPSMHGTCSVLGFCGFCCLFFVFVGFFWLVGWLFLGLVGWFGFVFLGRGCFFVKERYFHPSVLLIACFVGQTSPALPLPKKINC